MKIVETNPQLGVLEQNKFLGKEIKIMDGSVLKKITS